MCRSPRLLLHALALIAVTAIAGPASAGWICVKNETKASLIIQEVPDHPGAKRGKLVRLLPGEVYREYQPAAGARKVQVYDARCPGQPLCVDKMVWPAKGDVTLKLESIEEVVRLAPVPPVKKAPVVVQTGSTEPSSSSPMAKR